jgi:glycosyltransferase involved in cell wall biosynthesis
VIIPTYCEGNTVIEIAQAVLNLSYKVIVVDDGSTDNTEIKLIENEIPYIKHEKNLGQGAALNTGMKYASQNKYDIVIHFDADGQHRVEDIAFLVEPIVQNKVDVCLGSRFLGKLNANIPFKKRLILKVGRYIEFIFTGILLSDVHNGFRAMNYRAYSKMNLHLDRMAHASEIIYFVKKYKLRYLEVPVKINYFNQKHKKAQSFSHAFKIAWTLFTYKLKYG